MERREDRALLITLLTVSVVSLLVGLAALGLVIDAYVNQPAEQAASRALAAEDSCYLLRGLVASATPPAQKAKAAAYIAATPLHNCKTYGRKLVYNP